jgi:hypothetical protein
VIERPNHGAPAFYIRKTRSFVMFVDNHHHDGRLALWCAAPPGAQAMLIDSAPDHYFVPPYVGPSGWIGVRRIEMFSPFMHETLCAASDE